MNEFSDMRWFCNGLAEPSDPRVLRLGPPPPLPIVKTAGAPTGGFAVLRHRGEGGRFNVGYGITSAQVFGQQTTTAIRLARALHRRGIKVVECWLNETLNR